MKSALFVLCLVLGYQTWMLGQSIPPFPGIRLQGSLTDNSGNPLNGVYSLTVRIYKTPSGGIPIYTEVYDTVKLSNGVLDVMVDAVSLTFDSLYWIETQLGNEVFSPRTQLASVPYAFHASWTDTASYAKSAPPIGPAGGELTGTYPNPVLQDSSITTAKIKDGTIQRADVQTDFKSPYSDTADYAKSYVGIGAYLPLAGGVMTGAITNTGNPSITMGKGNFGTNNKNPGLSAIVAGMNNQALGDYSVINGGGHADSVAGNIARGDHSIIGGGFLNVADSSSSTIGGGQNNYVRGFSSTIGGGQNNQSLGIGSTVSGGWNNSSAAEAGTISGGAENNLVNAKWSTIAGGSNNGIWFEGGSIGGGAGNTVSSQYGTIAGGSGNEAHGNYSTIAGGMTNYTRGEYSVIGGGGGPTQTDSNSALGILSVIVGGRGNFAKDSACTIGGGVGNFAGRMVLFSFAGPYATVSGGLNNYAGASGAFIGGGINNKVGDENDDTYEHGYMSSIAGGEGNMTIGWYDVISGGHNNNIYIGSGRSTIGGGANNLIYDKTDVSTIGGGSNNQIGVRVIAGTISGGQGNGVAGNYSSIGGGGNNSAGRGPAEDYEGYATVAGGLANVAYGDYSSISGGKYNLASGLYSTVPGGDSNAASGNYSFAAGHKAKAIHPGSFVWADSTDADLSSTANNQFNLRASGGTRIFSNSSLSAGVTLAAGASSWSSVSDSTLKRNIRLVDGNDILSKLVSLPIKQWSYKAQVPSIEHIGPMAQDFYRIFGLGDDDMTISTIDPSGIALVAVQQLKKENDELTNRVRVLEKMLNELIAQQGGKSQSVDGSK